MYYTRILMKNCQNKKFLKFKMAAGSHIGFKKKPPGLFSRIDRNLKLWGLGYLNQPKNDLRHKISGLIPFWPFDLSAFPAGESLYGMLK
jgi:hypothetical protein